MNFILKFLIKTIIALRSEMKTSDEITVCLKRTISYDDVPSSKRFRLTGPVVESLKCKRIATCDDAPSSKRIRRGDPVVESISCKRTITCDDAPNSKRICLPKFIADRCSKHTITCDDEPSGKRIRLN